MKRVLSYFLACSLLFFTGCGRTENKKEPYAPDTKSKPGIVCAIFPQYDFAKTIAGDKMDVSMLLTPGAESHSFEPKASDILKVTDCDLFIYIDKNVENFALSLIEYASEKNVNILCVAEALHIETAEHTHDKEDSHGDEHNHEEGSDEHDPHIWTSPHIAADIVTVICDSIIKIDAANESYYRSNAEKLRSDILELDTSFETLVAKSKLKTIYFGGRFALKNFTDEYNLDCHSAFDFCGDNTEPKASAIAEIIDEMKANKAGYVFYEELIQPNVAEMIAGETSSEILLFHSCHNVSKSDFNNGATYLGLMNQNYANLKKALNI